MRRATSILAAAFALASAASADTIQATGPIIALSVNHPTAAYFDSHPRSEMLSEGVRVTGDPIGALVCPENEPRRR